MSEARALKNPNTWAYSKLLQGKEVNPLHYTKKVMHWHHQELLHVLEQTARLNDQIVVASRILKRGQRTRYQDRRVQIGSHAFYFFSRICPADVGVLLDLTPGKVLYVE